MILAQNLGEMPVTIRPEIRIRAEAIEVELLRENGTCENTIFLCAAQARHVAKMLTLCADHIERAWEAQRQATTEALKHDAATNTKERR